MFFLNPPTAQKKTWVSSSHCCASDSTLGGKKERNCRVGFHPLRCIIHAKKHGRGKPDSKTHRGWQWDGGTREQLQLMVLVRFWVVVMSRFPDCWGLLLPCEMLFLLSLCVTKFHLPSWHTWNVGGSCGNQRFYRNTGSGGGAGGGRKSFLSLHSPVRGGRNQLHLCTVMWCFKVTYFPLIKSRII